MASGIFLLLLFSPLFSPNRALSLSIGFYRSNGPAAETSELLLRQFEGRYRDAETLQVTFLERYFDNGRVVRVEAGEAYFLRPGKMRWDYQSPEKNTFLMDGKYVWFYSPADHTATRMPAKQSEDWRTPIAFLTSHMKLSRLCSEVSVAQDQKPVEFGSTLYHCVLRVAPGPDSSSKKSVYFEVSPAGELSRIMIPQEGGVEIEFSFSAWRWNPLLDRSLFQFYPPRGVAIVDGLLPDTPGLRQ
jgi:outer membrane lipoprotein carrier protein